MTGPKIVSVKGPVYLTTKTDIQKGYKSHWKKTEKKATPKITKPRTKKSIGLREFAYNASKGMAGSMGFLGPTNKRSRKNTGFDMGW